MLTDAEIAAASDTLSTINKLLLETRLREHISGWGLGIAFTALSAALLAATADQNKLLNGALDKLQALGPSTVALKGGRDAVHFSNLRDQEYWCNYVLASLGFQVPSGTGGIGQQSSAYGGGPMTAEQTTDVTVNWPKEEIVN